MYSLVIIYSCKVVDEFFYGLIVLGGGKGRFGSLKVNYFIS